MDRSLFSALCVVLAAGCGASHPPPPAATSGATAPAVASAEAPPAAAEMPAPADPGSVTPAAWYPTELLTGPSDGGPGLYLSADPSAPAIGYVSAGVVVEIAGDAEGGRVPVRIRGAMRVRGHLPLDRLHARVLQRGRLNGTPLYLGPNDIVRVIRPVDATTMEVEATVALRADGAPGPSYVGTFPSASLGGAVVAVPTTSGVPGAPVGASEPVPVYDRPGGELVLTVPASAGVPMRVAAQRDGWSAVLVGAGPYVAGYTQAALSPVAEPPVHAPTAPATGGLPARLTLEPELTLHHLAAGTRVVFDGVTVAALDQPGYARELGRHEATAELDVFVAVDDQIAVRGMIPLPTTSTPPGL